MLWMRLSNCASRKIRALKLRARHAWAPKIYYCFRMCRRAVTISLLLCFLFLLIPRVRTQQKQQQLLETTTSEKLVFMDNGGGTSTGLHKSNLRRPSAIEDSLKKHEGHVPSNLTSSPTEAAVNVYALEATVAGHLAKNNTTEHPAVSHVNTSVIAVVTGKQEKPPLMLTYFQNITDGNTTSDAAAAAVVKAQVLAVWEKAWQARGWETRVLGHADAKKHEDYKHLTRVLDDCHVDMAERPTFYRFLAIIADTMDHDNSKAVVYSSDTDTFPMELDANEGHRLAAAATSSSFFTSFDNEDPNLLSGNSSEYNRIIHHVMNTLSDNTPFCNNNNATTTLADVLMEIRTKDRDAMQWNEEEAVVLTELPYRDGALQCQVADGRLAIHLTQAAVADAFQEYATTDQLGKFPVPVESVEEAVDKRAVLAEKIMEDYQSKCLPIGTTPLGISTE